MTTLTRPYQPRQPWWQRLLPIPVMDRYIISELLPTFLFGVGAFTSIGVSVDSLFYLVNQVVEKGLPVAKAIEVLLLKFPEFIVYGLPMATLLSTLMTFGRLSSDSELVALRGCGISTQRLMMPALIFCLLITGLMFAFNESIVPAANLRASTTLRAALNQEQVEYRESNILYQEFQQVQQPDGSRESALARIFYSKEFDGKRMRGLTILDFSREGLNQIVSAESAQWNPQQSAWDFENGTIYVVSPDGSFRNIVRFTEQQLALPRSPLDLAQRSKDYGEMNIAESREYLKIIEPAGNLGKIRELRVRIQQKISLPFVCVVFGLVGATLGSQLRRAGRSTGFAISILIIFAYYILYFIFGAIAQAGALPPVLGAWIPNLFGLAAGLLLMIRASR
nr:LptF/LptG family permease [Thermoleptolyngbya sp. M55_K2018_002]